MELKSSNPAFGKTFEGSAVHAGYGQTMTISGTANKAGILMLIVAFSASWVWNQFFDTRDISSVSSYMMLGGIGGFILQALASTGMALQFAQIPEKATELFDTIGSIFGDADAKARFEARQLKLKEMSFLGLIIDALGLDLLGITDPFATQSPTAPSYLQNYNGGVPASPNVYVNVTLDGDKISDKVTTRVVNNVRGTTTWRNPQ